MLELPVTSLQGLVCLWGGGGCVVLQTAWARGHGRERLPLALARSGVLR